MITKLNPWERKVNHVVMAISFGFLHDIKTLLYELKLTVVSACLLLNSDWTK
jgi:type III secretory pathway component EscS